MADRVIIVGANRRGERIPIGELKQMIGRAGRGHEGGECHADIIVEESDEEYVSQGIELSSGLNVESVLSDDMTLAFHVLPEICMGEVCDIDSANEWHRRSLHAHSGAIPDWDRIFGVLQNADAVKRHDQRIMSTTIGDIASSFYFHAVDVKAWKDNFSIVFRLGLENDDVAVAWALGNVEMNRRSGDFGKNWEIMDEYRNRLPAGLEMNKGCLITSVLWWHVFGGPPVGKMRNQSLELKEDFGRIHRVLVELDKRVAKWEMVDFIDDLLMRSRKAISAELSDLCKMPGLTKGQAVALHEMGIDSRKALRAAKGHTDLTEILGEGYDIP